MDAHRLIIDSTKKLGFITNDAGLCFGIAQVAADMILSGKLAFFVELLDLIRIELSPLLINLDDYQVVLAKSKLKLHELNKETILPLIKTDGKTIIIFSSHLEPNIEVAFVNHKKLIKDSDDKIFITQLDFDNHEREVWKQLLPGTGVFVGNKEIPQVMYFFKKSLRQAVKESILSLFLKDKIAAIINKRNETVVKKYKDLLIQGKTREEHLNTIKDELLINSSPKTRDKMEDLKQNNEQANEIFVERYGKLFKEKELELEASHLTKEERNLLQLMPLYN